MTSWFLRPAGRIFVRAVAYSGVAGGFLVYYLPNTVLIDQFQQITQLYRNGIPVKPSEKIPPLVEAAMNDLQIDKDKRNLISVYTGFGFDLSRAGSLLHSPKCVLGLPDSFKYSDIEEFDETGILVNNEDVPWSNPAGKSLKESFILSDDAKKFAIARELAHLNTPEPFLNGIFTSAVLFMCYTVSSNVNRKLNFYSKPKSLRLILYVLVSAFSSATWVLCKDVSCVSFESDADNVASKINEKYAKGGLEFYEKILQRNIALRSLMGDTGKSLFTAYGNDEVFLRTRHLPYTTRRDLMKERLQEFSKDEAAVPDVKK